jgi:hypothetical protein
MKTNCIGVSELLCAYADGELEKSKIQIVEDHLLICENCSAILKLYREISTAIDDTNVPAPDILRPGVMNRIQHEEIYTDTERIKKRKQFHFILTRFAPVAACLIVGLIIWQPWSNTFNRSGDMAMPASQSADSELYGMEAPHAAGEPENSIPSGEMADADGSGGSGVPEDINNLFDDTYESDGALRRVHSEDIESFREHINGAYAEIIIEGELPALLERYIPQAFGPWFEWDMVIEIPITEMPALLDELDNREESAITRNTLNASSPYVMVFFNYEG